MSDLYGIGTIVSSVLNNITNGVISNKNLKEQQKQFAENMAFQREQYEYQKEQNLLQQQREDTAVQRKMQDLRSSGLNPLTAAAEEGASSTGGSSTAFTGTDAAQNQFQSDFQAELKVDSLLELMQQKSNIANTEAEVATKAAQIDEINQNILESQERITHSSKQREEIEENMKRIREEIDTMKYNLNWSKLSGIRTTDGIDPRATTAWAAANRAANAIKNKENGNPENSGYTAVDTTVADANKIVGTVVNKSAKMLFGNLYKNNPGKKPLNKSRRRTRKK